MKFEWDERKARANLGKHGVSFEQAAKVFDDPYLLEAPQAEDFEERWKAVGRAGQKVLVVVYTERGAKLRIISAREADKREQKTYFQNVR